MKVSLVLYSGKEFGGAERRMVRVFDAIGASNDVTLVARSATKEQVQGYFALAGCEPTHFKDIVGIRRDSTVAEDVAVIRELTRGGYDCCVFVDCSRFSNVAARIVRARGVKTVLVFAYGLYYYEARAGHGNLCIDSMLKAVDHVDLLYPDQQVFYEQKIAPRSTLSITPNTFTDLDLLTPAEKKNKFVFLAARLEEDKNPGMVIEAARLCQDELRAGGYLVQVCGQGFEERVLRKKIADYAIGDIVEMPGYVKPHDVLPDAQVLLAVGLTNNYPSQTIAEAAACGCAVIATDVGETYRLYDECYMTIIEPTAQRLSEAMCRFIGLDAEARKGIVAGARRYALAHFSISSAVPYYTGILEGLHKNQTNRTGR